MISFPYYSNTAATTAAVANRFVATTAMSLTTYTIANASPVWSGGCNITILHATVAGTDTLGTVTIVGTDLNGQALTEIITPTADTTVTGTKVFRTVTSATSLGWVAVSTADNITIGCAAGNIVAAGGGVFGSATSNNSVAATIAISDKRGTIATLPASAAAFYNYNVQYVGYLKVATTSTNDVTVTHTGTVPAFPNG